MRFIILLFLFFQTCTGEILKTIELEYEGAITPPHSILVHELPRRPQIGLALSGGGLRGIAQIGVLKSLVDHGIPIDYIVGTSIGSVIGGFYAVGYTPEEIYDIFLDLDFSQLLTDSPDRARQFLGQKQQENRAWIQFRLNGLKPFIPRAYTPGQKLSEFLTDMLLNAPYHSQDFSSLKVPLKILATDLLSGKKVMIDKGNLAVAMRASIAIPLLLTPVPYDSLLLVDGGLLDNIPVEETKNAGADVVIAVNSTSPLRNRGQIGAPWEMADQVTTIMQVPLNKKQLEKADLIIDFSDLALSSMESDTKKLIEFYQLGISRTNEKIDEIKSALLIRSDKFSSGQQSYFFDRVRIFGKTHDHDPVLLSQSYSETSAQEIYKDLYRFYETGYYSDVKATIEKFDQEKVLTFHLEAYPILNKVEFIGNSVFSDSALQAPFKPLLGKTIHQRTSQTALEKIIRFYRKKHYALAEVDSIAFDSNTGVAQIYLQEGNIEQIAYLGLQSTQKFVVSREFTLDRRQLFQSNLAKQGIDNIFATGIFQSVGLKPIRTLNGWLVQLDLEEKQSQLLRLGGHYNRERNGMVFAEFADENLFGLGNKMILHGKYGDRDLAAMLAFRADRLFKTYLTFEFEAFNRQSEQYAYKDYSGTGEYNRRSTGIIAKLGQQIERFGTLSLFMRREEINIRSVSGSGYDPGKLNISTFGFNTIIDTRDAIPFPKQGKYHEFYYEVSTGNVLNADMSYFKTLNNFRAYWQATSRHIFSPRILWGFSDQTTPFAEQFFKGGRDSFYGLHENEMRGRHIFIASMEYRFLLPWKLLFDTYLTSRFDFGAVWENVIKVSGQDFINGRGVGVAIKSPIGPVYLCYGQASNKRQNIYFSLGFDF
jgi:NTE family protein